MNKSFERLLWFATVALIVLMLGLIVSCADAASIDDKLNKIPLPSKCAYVVTSGKRSVEHNRSVGGAKNSYHLKNRARDVFLYNKDSHMWMSTCVSIFTQYAMCLDLTVLVYKSHVHIDDRKSQKCYKVSKKGVYKACPKEWWCE